MSRDPQVWNLHGRKTICGVLEAKWEELAGKVGHCDQLIIC